MTRSRRRKLQRQQAAERSVAARRSQPVTERSNPVRRGTKALIIALPLAPMLFASTPARAQQPTAPSRLEEMTVTAQKREEDLQDVALSIQALDTERLEELQIQSFEDYIKYLPSVSYQTTGPGFGLPYFRGVANGENNNHSGPQPTVGIYLDEMPITMIQGAVDMHLYDIARVEALAGPQGTLYGASSMAGTIRIITNKPDPSEFSAGYGVELNTVKNGSLGYVGEGFVNVPITDASAIRLVGWYREDSGYIDNVRRPRVFPTSGGCIENTGSPRPGCASSPEHADDHYNDGETYGARAALGIDLNESWTITPTLMGQISNANGGSAFDDDSGDLQLSRYYPERSRDRWYQAALTVEGKIANFDLVYAGGYLDRDDVVQSDYSDYAYFYDVLYGYGSSWVDDAGVPLADPSQYIHGKDYYGRQFHELRLSSPAEDRLRFVTGLFYQRQEHDIYQRYKIDGLGGIQVFGWPDTIWLTNQERVNSDSAIFGELSFDVTEQLTVTGGLRGYRTKDSLKGFFGFSHKYSGNYGEALCFSPERFHGSPCVNLDDTVKESGVIPKANVTYRLTDDHLIYLNYARGFRPGGVNRNGTVAPYVSDTLDSYELGMKTAWQDGRVRVNGAFFVENWRDMQFSFLPPSGSGLTVIGNAGRAQIVGLELDLGWLPTDNLELFGGLALIDAKLIHDYRSEPETPTEAESGDQLPVTPKFKANLTARYSFELGEFGGFVQGSGVYQTSSWSDLLREERALIGSNDAYFTGNFSVGVERDTYGLQLYVENAFDERADINKFSQCDVPVCANPANGTVYTVTNQPRTFGLRLSKRF